MAHAGRLLALGLSALALAVTFGGGTAGAVTLVTVTTTDDVVDGSDDLISLREAVDMANSDGDATTIQLTAGATYALDICGADEDLNASGDLDYTEDQPLTVQGDGATIDQDCAGERILQSFEAVSVVSFDGITLTGGNGLFDGAAVQFGGDLNLTDSTVSGNDAGPGRVLEAAPATSGSAMTVTGSVVGPNTGTGMALSFGTVVVADSDVSSNTGRGIGLTDGKLTISGSTISGNGQEGARTTGQGSSLDLAVTDTVVTNNGGTGITCSACGDLTVTDSTVAANHPAGLTSGGGILFAVDMDAPGDQPKATILRSTVRDNTSTSGGAALRLDIIEASDGGPAHVVVDSSTLSGNHAQGASGQGGAIFTETGDLEILNSTLSGNTADVAGGAVYVTDEEVRLRHATIVENSSPSAAGVRAGAGLEPFASVIADGSGGTDCVVAGGTTSLGYNVDGDGSCGLAGPGDQPAAGSAQLMPLAENGGPTRTRLPSAGSPVLDAVPAPACSVAVDQRGEPRPQGPACEAGAVEVGSGGAEERPAQGPGVSGDFDGDGRDDLAVGAPGEDIAAIADAGAVNVIYGGGSGLSATGDQQWHQDAGGVDGTAEPGDRFGSALAAGDFDGDGRDDLAVGAPGEGVGSVAGGGAVTVLYGSASGLAAAGSESWHQDVAGIDGAAEAGDGFGAAVAAGDFDGDDRDDLAAGVPKEDVAAIADAGLANVIRGGAGGLGAADDQVWHQDVSAIEGAAEAGDRFAAALATADFDGDGRDDIAAGAPEEDVASVADAGSVNEIQGGGAGLGAAGNRQWHQDVAGIEGEAEAGDGLGSALAAGDFDGDDRDDLAAGAPGEGVGAAGGAGAVNAIYGDGSGLGAASDQQWHQDVTGIEGAAEAGDGLGSALAAGSFDGDGRDDLAAGAPAEGVGAAAGAGGANAIYGSGSGLGAAGDDQWHQDVAGIEGAAEAGDAFGAALAAADFDGDDRDDLAAGVPDEDVAAIADAGLANVIRGGGGGLGAAGDQAWHQDVTGIEGAAEAADRFGAAL